MKPATISRRALEVLEGAVTIVEGGTVNRLPLVLERIQG